MNQITIMGRIGGDPEIRDFQGTSVANFSVAVSEHYKDKSGEKKELTQWFRVSFWGKQAEVIKQYFHKGDGILVMGSMRSSEYEKDGVKQRTWEVRGDRFEFPITKKADNGDAFGSDAVNNFESQAPAKTSAPEPAFTSEVDDLPF